MYQKHLALENKQNALNEVVTIPIDNGVSDTDAFSAKSVATSEFEHVEFDGSVSFFTYVRSFRSKFSLT